MSTKRSGQASRSTWRDVSCWSKSDTDRTPKSWEVQLGYLRLVVTRHIDYPGKWMSLTYPDVLGLRELESSNIDDAKVEALERLDVAINAIIEARRAVR